MNLWLILVGQPGPASNRNSAGKAQRPTAVIGGRFPPNPFLKDACPRSAFGVAMSAIALQNRKDGFGSTAAVRERPGKPRLLARQRRDSGRHPSGSHQGWSGHTSAQPVHASSKMSYTQSTFV